MTSKVTMQRFFPESAIGNSFVAIRALIEIHLFEGGCDEDVIVHRQNRHIRRGLQGQGSCNKRG